ncbi:2-hydroxyacid dehydrogenase [Azohydromonas caseinilytica]|uniref:Glyoxylate/hydroxypyruvate reductase A n=1 Tax=Azohydromonas caseinilytica TaxID=2728836 RepID=A0A848FEH9_9BURK|nr:glyoxylate/hydroxypyruvate reductase A [Azohydromonas caseinilytica]NML16301.1 glyoxylate/hydroxypyruvate reductase A [Azohydromonas caseinilytica]
MKLALVGQLGVAERETWEEALRQALPEAQWVEAAPGAEVDVALVANPPPGRLQGLRGLRLIQSLWAGVDRLLADTTLPEGVPIARMVDPAMNAAMAETALWAVLSLHRGFFDYARQQREGVWRQLPQRRADELRVTVLGLGEMGLTAARRLVAMGYRVQGWSARPRQEAGIECVHGEDALPGLLARSDIVVNLLPLTAATRGLFDARRLALLPEGASLVNLARGGHVVEADLLAALDSGRLRHAVLDVFQTEPLPAESPFWNHPRVTLLPHAAALTDARSAAVIAAGNVRAVMAGETPAHRVEFTRGY